MCGVLYAIDEKPETHLKVFKEFKTNDEKKFYFDFLS